MRSFVAIVAAFLLFPVVAFAGPLEDGKAAYDRHDYQSAMALWMPLAQGGNAKAQVYVGSLFADGKGVMIDSGEAVDWYQKAAQQGDKDATQALKSYAGRPDYGLAVNCEDGVGKCLQIVQRPPCIHNDLSPYVIKASGSFADLFLYGPGIIFSLVTGILLTKVFQSQQTGAAKAALKHKVFICFLVSAFCWLPLLQPVRHVLFDWTDTPYQLQATDATIRPIREKADEGDVEAQNTLGGLYFWGYFVTDPGKVYPYGNKADCAEAYFWESLAARSGRVSAAGAESAARGLGQDDIAAVKRRLQDWKPKPASDSSVQDH